MHLSQLQQQLKAFGELDDMAIPLADTLLMLGSVEREGDDIEPYRTHLDDMRRALADTISANPRPDDMPVLRYRLDRLNDVIRNQFAYGGDRDGYDDADMINLLTVIDKRAGIPVAIGVLYMILADSQNWPIAGINFPGHFLLRLADGANGIIFDPFHAGAVMNAAHMRTLLKDVLGARAELHHHYYDTVTRRDVILRFCNNRKTRLIASEDYTRALQTIRHQLWVAPREPRLYYDAGVLSARIGQLQDALGYLHEFIQMSDDVRTIAEAQSIMAGLRRVLN